MTEYKNLLTEQQDKVLVVRINRENALNALNKETIGELQKLFDGLKKDNSVGCVIVTGAGEKAFVAGADILELAETNVQSGAEVSATGLHLMKTIQDLARPVIAAVNGFALGGGCELAMACDIRLASEKAKFGQPEVNLGIIPGYGGTQRLSRLVGKGKALELITTGAIIGADEAHRIGLVDEVYPPDDLMTKAIEMANLICSKGPIAIQLAKDSIHRGFDVDLAAGCEIEKSNFGKTCGTNDKTEGMKAFMEKRAAKFSGN